MEGVKVATRSIKGHVMTGLRKGAGKKDGERLWAVQLSSWRAGGDICQNEGSEER